MNSLHVRGFGVRRAPYLEPHLRGRKQVELPVWTEAIDVRTGHIASRRRGERLDLTPWRHRLQRLRTYAPREAREYRAGRRGRRLRSDPLEALRAWASRESGPLTATAYTASRRDHPEWPTRNTLARRYGTWHAALAAAGLAHRAVSSPELAMARAAGARTGHERRKASHRERLVGALRVFAETHGRLPHTMTEFFVWTRANAPDAPTQASLYHLFDGGWTGFLVAASELTASG